MFCKGGTCTAPIFVFKVARNGERTKIKKNWRWDNASKRFKANS